MILLISSLTKVHNCVPALQEATKEAVKVCSSSTEAVAELQGQEFSAVIFDQQLLDSDPDEGHGVLKHLGTATPVYVNFAISATGRVIRELRSALHRRKWELAAANQEARQSLRNELNNTMTALLLSCETVLQVPELPALAETRMHEVETLAREMSSRLEAIG
jgi:hypothetical protein